MCIQPRFIPLGFLGGLYCFVIALNASFAQQPSKSYSWNASLDCLVEQNDRRLRLLSSGKDPHLSTREVPPLQEPLSLEFRMKSQAEGGGQLFWLSADETAFVPENSLNFSPTHNALWHEYRLPFTPAAPLVELRLDPCSSPGQIELEGLRLVNAEGITVKEWVPRAACSHFSGDAVIRQAVGKSEIVITTTNRLAGAIHSLTWNGQEFIDSVDHGRQLQSACSFGNAGPFHAECYNPTEAGSRIDSAGERSSSRLLQLQKTENSLQTLSQMAFWLAPWEKSEGKPALNKESRSNHTISKRVKIGYRDMPQVIPYEVTFRIPEEERHTFAQFESLTAYMPVQFDHCYGFQAHKGELEPLADGRGEQPLPIVLATADGKYAMGVFSPEPADRRLGKPSYGRFNFREQHVMKWNCVYRLRDKQGVEPGEYHFQHFVVLGDLATVRDSLRALHQEFNVAGWLTPSGKFPPHDLQRPVPTMITPGAISTPEQAGQPPSDAVSLFNGRDFSNWTASHHRSGTPEKPIPWKIEKDYIEIMPKSVSIHTREKFRGDHQLHLEWRTPEEVKGSGQNRGNSGLFLGGFGEIQILDSFQNDTYPDGQAAALYGRYPPLVNASRKPGEWQTYDIILRMARINAKNEIVQPACVTLLHNGVVVHHAVEFQSRQQDFQVGLQDHYVPMRFRNLWVRKLGEYDSNQPIATSPPVKQ